MVHKTTVRVAQLKQEERERLVSEMESLLGLQSEHPEDEQYISPRPEEIVGNLKSHKKGWTAERVMIAFVGDIAPHLTCLNRPLIDKSCMCCSKENKLPDGSIVS